MQTRNELIRTKENYEEFLRCGGAVTRSRIIIGNKEHGMIIEEELLIT